MRKSSLSALALLPFLWSAAVAQEGQRDLTVEQAGIANFAPPASTLRLELMADHPDGAYAIGDTARLFVRSNEDAFIAVYSVGPTGDVTQLFPNRFQPDNRVRANQRLEIAGEAFNARINVTGPVGRELVKVIGSSKPLTFISEDMLRGGDAFRKVEGGVAQFSRNLSVLSSTPATDRKLSVAQLTLRTVADRNNYRTSGGDGSHKVPTFPVVTSQRLPASAFPVLVAVDRPSYRVGEAVTLAVTSLKACHLSVIEMTSSGATRVLFPNKLVKDNALAAGQTMLISGGASPIKLDVTGPEGVEQILAICTREPTPVFSMPGDSADLFRSLGDRSEVNRDLSVVSSRPEVGTGTVSFVVEK